MTASEINWFAHTQRLLDLPAGGLRRIRAVRAAEAGHAALEGCLACDSGADAWFRLAITGDLGVRLQLGPTPPAETVEVTSILAGPPPAPAPGAGIDTDADGWTLTAAAGWRLRVRRDPFALALHAANGALLWCSEHDDRKAFNGGFAAPPLGLVEDGVAGRVVLSAALRADEALYGLGERFGPLDQRGQAVPCCNRGGGTWNQGFHKCVPLLLSSRGYGLFVHTGRPVLFDLGQRANSSVSVAVADRHLDCWLLPGDPATVLAAYTALTGRAELPPDWVWGIWMGCHTYTRQDEVLAAAAGMRQRACPVDVFKIDTGWFHRPGRGSVIDHDMEWGPGFPDPPALTAALHADGLRLCVFVQAWFLADSPKAREARRFGHLLRRPDGSEHSWLMGPGCPVVATDLSREPARLWWKAQLRQLLADGVDTFFCDWGVDTPAGLAYERGDPVAYANTYALTYLRSATEAIVEHQGGGPAAVWSLSGWAGAQRYPVTYSGDSRTTFRDLASTLRGGLACSLSGFPLWGAEIGGFGNLEVGPPDPELYIRYLQHGFLLPLAEFHGIGAREPWHYGDAAVEAYRRFAELRYRLLPYLRTQAVHACRTGLPVLRPLVLAYPQDPAVRHLDLQYLLGSDLLVVPVAERGARRVRAYLPSGGWYDWWTGERRQGPGWIEVEAPLDRIGLFVREGAIIPVGPGGQRAAEAFSAPPAAHAFGPAASGVWFDGTALRPARVERGSDGRPRLVADGWSGELVLRDADACLHLAS